MHHFPYPSYLRTHRKRWGLTQPQLGALLGGLKTSTVYRYEKLIRTPSVQTLVGAEFIFGEPAREIFPALYATIEAGVTLRAVDLAETLAGRTDAKASDQRELLEAIARRAASDAPHV